MSTSSSSEIQSKTITQKPTGPEGSDTVATVQGVPGWGIAILVLAAIILFFMLVLLILLLLFWCCCWKQRGFMHVSDPDPTGYYNPDIPMYSTQSTYDSHNGKSLDLDPERPQKNRSGTYTVNK
ncbi:mucin-1-like [Tachysurus fulvidraco]|uniref:mucin-1-like n=1 Tax=Tachysurus fulvidraco TaxID=1234273 RepID=UPI001FED4F09|nr:mucin-1-like [Tachysurus fulvidraco]